MLLADTRVAPDQVGHGRLSGYSSLEDVCLTMTAGCTLMPHGPRRACRKDTTYGPGPFGIRRAAPQHASGSRPALAAQAPAAQHRRQSAVDPGRVASLFTGDAATHPARHGSGPAARRR